MRSIMGYESMALQLVDIWGFCNPFGPIVPAVVLSGSVQFFQFEVDAMEASKP